VELLIAALNLLFIFSVSWWIWKSESAAIRKFYWPALILKLAAGILVGIIYSRYYTQSDTFFFFNQAVDGASKVDDGLTKYFNFLFSSSGGYYLGEDRMNFLIKVTSIFCLLTYNNYWIISLYFSLFSFLSAWWLTKFISNYISDMTISACIAFLFFPSCVFWSSGIMKESLAMTALFFLAGVFLKLWFEKKILVVHILVSLFFIWIGWNLKYYYIGLFAPILLSVWIARLLSKKFAFSGSSEIFLMLIILSVGLTSASYLHPNFSLHKVLEVIVSNNDAFVQLSSPNDVIHFYNLEATWSSLIINSPWALFSGLFRPFVWEATNLMQVFASLENLLILILTLVSFRGLALAFTSKHRLLFLAIVIYCVMLCVFLSLSSPNFGTLVRYRVGFLPFFILLVTTHPLLNKHLSKLL
jgi:hypothetical protein